LKTALLLGIGNILLKDEGVGVHVVNAMKEGCTFSPEVEIIDGGTLGLDLLPFIEGKEGLLIIDAVNFGKAPGYIGILENEEIPSTMFTRMSVHHIGLADVLFSAELLDIKPAHICLIGIQPQSLDVGLDMTDCIAGKVEELITLAISKLKEWNITCASRSPQKSSA
jgi:hydrogenase maturation protease